MHVQYVYLCVCVGARGVRARSAALQVPQLAGAAQFTAFHSSQQQSTAVQCGRQLSCWRWVLTATSMACCFFHWRKPRHAK